MIWMGLPWGMWDISSHSSKGLAEGEGHLLFWLVLSAGAWAFGSEAKGEILQDEKRQLDWSIRHSHTLTSLCTNHLSSLWHACKCSTHTFNWCPNDHHLHMIHCIWILLLSHELLASCHKTPIRCKMEPVWLSTEQISTFTLICILLNRMCTCLVAKVSFHIYLSYKNLKLLCKG